MNPETADADVAAPAASNDDNGMTEAPAKSTPAAKVEDVASAFDDLFNN